MTINLLINALENGIISDSRVENAMLAVDRGNYIRNDQRYVDSPMTIGFGATISAPHMARRIFCYKL